ncbi:MAG: hemolysin III family protein [Dehalococcoidia bacterium]
MVLAVARKRPLLRGYSHLAAALIAPFALLALLLIADSPRAYVGAAVFGASLILLFSTSAGYHLLPWPPRVRAFVQRVDHSMIFVAVTGMYVPFCLQAMPMAWGISVLSVIGGLALAGIVLKQAWFTAPRWLGVTTYVAVGWTAIVAIPALELGGWSMALLAASGLLYTVGAVCFATGRPRLAPSVFGHHEVFHAMVILGTGLIYGVVSIDVLPR